MHKVKMVKYTKCLSNKNKQSINFRKKLIGTKVQNNKRT